MISHVGGPYVLDNSWTCAVSLGLPYILVLLDLLRHHCIVSAVTRLTVTNAVASFQFQRLILLCRVEGASRQAHSQAAEQAAAARAAKKEAADASVALATMRKEVAAGDRALAKLKAQLEAKEQHESNKVWNR